MSLSFYTHYPVMSVLAEIACIFLQVLQKVKEGVATTTHLTFCNKKPELDESDE